MDIEQPLLDVQDVSLAYGQHVAVERLSLTVGAGECVALVGANGAGKSTSLRAIVGIHRDVRSGRIRHAGKDVTGWSSEASVRAGVILCPEGRHLFPGMSVHDNLLLGVAAVRIDRGEVQARIDGVEALFPVLKERKKQLAGTLSGGEQQMVALGRALMSRPKLLILDEPSLGLAPLLVERVFGIVTTILKTGCAVLIAEQNVQATLTVADRAYVMEAGRLITSGSAADIQNDPAVLSAFIGVDAAPMA